MHGVGAEELQYLALITRNLIPNLVKNCMRVFLLGLLALAGLGCQVRPAVTTAPVVEPSIPVMAEPVARAPVSESLPSSGVTPPAPVVATNDESYCHLGKSFCDRMHYVLSEERQNDLQPILVMQDQERSNLASEWDAFLRRISPDVAMTLREPLLLQVPQTALIDDGVMGPYIDPSWLNELLRANQLNGIAIVYWDFPAILHEMFIEEYGLVYRGRLSSVINDEEEVIAWLAYLTRGYETMLNQ